MRRGSAAYFLPVLLIGWLGMDSAADFRPEAQGEPRRQLVDPQQPPFSSVGKLKGEMTCTASAVIDPRIVVTAAHCVIHAGESVSRVAFQPSYPEDAAPIGGRVMRLGHDLLRPDRTASDEANDWAIILLDTAPSGSRPLALRVLDPSKFQDLHGRVMLPSYSADVADGEQLSAVERCSIDELRWSVLIHDCPCAYGASGAPLVVADGDWYALVGINSAMLYPVDRNRPARVLHAAVSASSFEAALREVVTSLREAPTPSQHTALERQP